MTVVVEARDIVKSYPGVRALRGVSLSFEQGEVCALLGKNGAGKSTLVKILSGIEPADSGTLVIGGQEVTLDSPRRAKQAGIATVHQELSVIDTLTVAENLVLGEWQTSLPGVINSRANRKRAVEMLDRAELDLRPDALVGSLTIAQKQLLEIAKAVAGEPRLLILDEPTSSLPREDVDLLLALVRRLADKGVACVYVSHRMKEIPVVADQVAVLRDGGLVGRIPVAEASAERIAEMMVGDRMAGTGSTRSDARRDPGRPLLQVEGLTREPHFRQVSLEVRQGEVVGLAGLLGSGRSELLHAIYGDLPPESGTVRVGDAEVRRADVRRMTSMGLGLVPEDRKKDGIIPMLSIHDNIAVSILGTASRAGVLRQKQIAGAVAEQMARLDVAAPNALKTVGTLSGGNQQKTVLGRWLAASARVLLLDEPTRGVDIAAKAQIYQLIGSVAAAGVAVLMVSSEFEELLACCDRIVIMNAGRITETRPTEEASLEWILASTMRAED